MTLTNMCLVGDFQVKENGNPDEYIRSCVIFRLYINAEQEIPGGYRDGVYFWLLKFMTLANARG